MSVLGNPYAGDGLWNIRLGPDGMRAGFWFVSPVDTEVDGLRYYNIYSTEKPGYSGGTGGKILISIQTDSKGFPSGETLCSTVVTNPNKLESQLMVTFTSKARITAEKRYHIVFENIDPKPEENYVSVNVMGTLTSRISRMGNIGVNLYYKGWDVYKRSLATTPIFTLYDGSKIAVPGYSGMESWFREPRTISGNYKVRQMFQADGQTVGNCWLYVGKIANSMGLGMRLLNKNGDLLGHAIVPDKQIRLADYTIKTGYPLGFDWVIGNFGGKITLPKERCFLELHAPLGSTYVVYPLRDGGPFGYAPLWDGGCAEYTMGGAWVGWDAWGKPNQRMGQLQMYFT